MNKILESLDLFIIWLFCGAMLALIISQVLLIGIIWAALVCGFIWAIHRILRFVFGPLVTLCAVPVVVVLAFVLSSDAIKSNRTGQWIIDHRPDLYNPYEFKFEQYHGNTAVATQNVAGSLRSKCMEDWAASAIQDDSKDNSFTYCLDNHIDVEKIMNKAIDVLNQWVADGAHGDAPIPTPQYMEMFVRAHRADPDVAADDPNYP